MVQWIGSHIRKLTIMAVLAIVIVALCILRLQAANIGAAAGNITGTAVGKALGSFKGVTEGYKKGEEDAKNEGLKAEDTTVSVRKTLASVGKLDVMSVGITLHNMNKIGDSDPAYRELSVVKGVIQFSVDLTDFQISFNKNKTKAFLYVKEPEPELSIDWANTEVLACVSKANMNVKATEGAQAIVNSINQQESKAKEALQMHVNNYDALYTLAEESAKEQIESLVKSVNSDCKEIQVIFARKSGEGR